MRRVLLMLLPALAAAQSYSAHSGWNFDDTLHAATEIFAGRIVAGSAADSGAEVRVAATIRVIRVLKGTAAPGSDLRLEWTYQPAPNQGPAVTTSVPRSTGIFFARKQPSGAYEALRASGMPALIGGFLLPVPETAPSSALLYTPDMPVQAKLARELAAAMQGWAPGLVERPATEAARLASLSYQALAMTLEQLEPAQVLPVFQYLSTLGDINLRSAGLLGRLASGDNSAIFEVEQDLPRIAASVGAGSFGPRIMGFDTSRDLAATHALARIGLSETPLPGVEGGMVFRLAATRSPEFLPYLMVLTKSPDPGTRGGALMGMCLLLRNVKTLWQPDMDAHCPTHAPLNDAEQERRDMEFWTSWWTAQRGEIAKTVRLPDAIVPARYYAGPPAGLAEVTDIPLEVRLGGLLGMSAARSQASHYHAGGDDVEGPPPGPPDPVFGQLPEADRPVYQRILDTANAKLEQNRQRAMDIINAARMAGTLADRSSLESIEAERQAVLAAAVAELRAGLSPQGWQALERFLMNMAIRVLRANPPERK